MNLYFEDLFLLYLTTLFRLWWLLEDDHERLKDKDLKRDGLDLFQTSTPTLEWRVWGIPREVQWR